MDNTVAVDLIAVLAAVTGGHPQVLTLAMRDALPSGPFEPGHRSLQSGLRAWVERQTHQPIGYVEQLYTFADSDRVGSDAGRVISISYLGLTREALPVTGVEQTGHGPSGAAETGPRVDGRWRGWYRYFPWEDQRAGTAGVITDVIAPRLHAWSAAAPDAATALDRARRAGATFGLDGRPWNEELVLQRYELLYEAGLVAEAARPDRAVPDPVPGSAMDGDHRRILATGIARLRAKIKYRPVVFELMPATFTLLQLQRCVEALSGVPVHKQNFRRLVESQDLIEETGEMSSDTGGRPAKLFRFRRAVLDERSIAGTKIPLART